MKYPLPKIFLFFAGLSFVLKSVFAMSIPLTSDEAYFVVWAKHLDFGYYDHPPMIGWIIRLMLCFGNSEYIIRIPAILSTIFIGAGIFFLHRDLDKSKSYLSGILFLASPLNIFSVFMTNDMMLLLFSFLSASMYYEAIKTDKYIWHAASGIFLGLAFLSKYFSVLLGLSYLVYFLFSEKTKRQYIGFAILLLFTSPFILINLYWNYHHCWTNIVFNLITRNKNLSFSVGKIATYLLMQLYLITPPLAYFLYQKRSELWRIVSKRKDFRLFPITFVIPLAIFFILSFNKSIGLHWAISFYPFLYMMMIYFLSEEEFHKAIKYMTYFSLFHLALVIVVLVLPLSVAKNNKNYSTIILAMKPHEINKELKPFEKDFIPATESYAKSALVSYYSDKYFMVFGKGSYHGRQDDIITDFRNYSGKNILILSDGPSAINKYKPYFDDIKLHTFQVHGAMYYVVLGSGFKYDKYRDGVLEFIRKTYYTIPSYLPLKRNFFMDKYFY